MSFFGFLFPQRCRGCGKPGRALCAHCATKIPRAKKIDTHSFAVFDYGNPLVRMGIRGLKYHRRSEFVRALAEYAIPPISEYLKETLRYHAPEPYLFVPIPEHRRKHNTRGFNQALLLARWWARRLEKSVVFEALEKTVFTLPQARLGRHDRLHNVRDTMQCTKILDPKKLYIIVDDVTTTGSTFDEARRALKARGAKNILSIALAHGYVRNDKH